MSAPSRARTTIDPTLRVFTCRPPRTRLRAVVTGMSTISSWSWPTMLCPLRSSTPSDDVRHAPDAHGFPDRVGLAEERPRHRLAEQHDLGRRIDMRLVEAPAAGDLPLPCLEELRRRAPDLRGPVAVAEHDLPATAQHGRSDLHAGHLPLERIGIVLGDCQLRARPLPRAAECEVAGQHDDEVRPQALDLVLDARLRAGTHGHHRDHRADADDDAEHRQRAAQLVHAQRGEGDTQRGQEIHAARPAVSAVRVASAVRASLGAFRVSVSEPAVAERQQAGREGGDVVFVRDDHDGDAAARSTPAART